MEEIFIEWSSSINNYVSTARGSVTYALLSIISVALLGIVGDIPRPLTVKMINPCSAIEKVKHIQLLRTTTLNKLFLSILDSFLFLLFTSVRDQTNLILVVDEQYLL